VCFDCFNAVASKQALESIKLDCRKISSRDIDALSSLGKDLEALNIFAFMELNTV
jgi:hypothetical protein